MTVIRRLSARRVLPVSLPRAGRLCVSVVLQASSPLRRERWQSHRAKAASLANTQKVGAPSVHFVYLARLMWMRTHQRRATTVLLGHTLAVERRYATSVLLAKSTRMRTQPVHALSVFLVNIGLEAAAT